MKEWYQETRKTTAKTSVKRPRLGARERPAGQHAEGTAQACPGPSWPTALLGSCACPQAQTRAEFVVSVHLAGRHKGSTSLWSCRAAVASLTLRSPRVHPHSSATPHPPLQFLSDCNKLQTISGLASSYPNLEQTMSSPAHGGTLTGRKFRLLTTLRNPDKTAAELGSCSQPFVAVTRDSLFSEDGEGEEGGDREGAESSSNTQENNRR